MFNRLFRKPKIIDEGADKVKTAVVQTTGPYMRPAKSPDESLSELFDAVQDYQVYPDGKTFVDMIPKQKSKAIVKEYMEAKARPGFDLNTFVNQHFYEFRPKPEYVYRPSDTTTTREHIANLWPVLERRNRRDRGSLIALPHEYAVPGGRFDEQFYWDSYFIMLGLVADGRWKMVDNMVRNCAYMHRKFGMIPTANRTYFLSRSQPPFLPYMVKLLARQYGRTRTYAEYLPTLVSEYRFWMKGRNSVSGHAEYTADRRAVQMPNGVILNRYFDDKLTPRPESRREDVRTATKSKDANKERIFLNLRAGAESGWDFSSRWFRDPTDIESIHTTDMVPVDLNCLLYQLELTIAEACTLLKQPMLARRYRAGAEQRAKTIRRYCWNETSQFFEDYDFRDGQTTGHITLAGVFPLFTKVATADQASAVAQRIERDFLKKGGLVTTLETSGQQWDAPNGWAPLEWVAIMGLREYGYHALANEIRDRWLALNDDIFAVKRKMVEKYNVVAAGVGGGGEYALQDGFGWTNGVYAALYDEREQERGA